MFEFILKIPPNFSIVSLISGGVSRRGCFELLLEKDSASA